MQVLFGGIEIYSYSSTLGGLVIGGWIDLSWDEPIEPPFITLNTEVGSIAGGGLMCLFPREDIKKHGSGFLLLLEAESLKPSEIISAEIRSKTQAFTLYPLDSLEEYTEERLFLHAKHFLQSAPANERRSRFRKLLDRAYFAGHETLSGYIWPVHLEIDKFYLCPPHGLAVRGWFLDPFHRVLRVRLCCGGSRQTLDPKAWVSIKRRDVADAFVPQYGSVDEWCGFLTYAPSIYSAGQKVFFEIEMIDGTVAFRPATPSLMTGLAAIKEILSCFDLRRDALNKAYDVIVGPLVMAMNAFRLTKEPEITTIEFGPQSVSPRCSIIIPLYGRIDFLEYQLAFFADILSPDHEIIYVLDDPDRAVETEALAISSSNRFERPFKLLMLSHNVGFAPANNIGLAHARGDCICFLNSDVFPRNPDWLEQMLETLTVEPNTGIVGARLVYEDSTLQHDGCTFERLPEFGNWLFPMHPGKGRWSEGTGKVTDAAMVTGACMVMRRSLAVELGGFDVGYVIGDFEDADLCFRVMARGLRCVVDNRAELYHLERQSQNLQGNAWRWNLTLYNAWRFQKLWDDRESTRHR